MNIDQNEKIIRYGVTLVGATDGYSGKLIDIVAMPIKTLLQFMIRCLHVGIIEICLSCIMLFIHIHIHVNRLLPWIVGPGLCRQRD